MANCGNFTVIWNFAKLKTTAADSISYGGLPTSMDYKLQVRWGGPRGMSTSILSSSHTQNLQP